MQKWVLLVGLRVVHVVHVVGAARRGLLEGHTVEYSERDDSLQGDTVWAECWRRWLFELLADMDAPACLATSQQEFARAAQRETPVRE